MRSIEDKLRIVFDEMFIEKSDKLGFEISLFMVLRLLIYAIDGPIDLTYTN